MQQASAARTFADKLKLANGRPAGFDYMRLFLASCVVVWHTIATTYGYLAEVAVWYTPWRILAAPIVPVFFVLSGFLVAGSLERCKTVAGFLFLRVIRIFPALVVEVIVSAFLLGPLFTTYTLPHYFSDPIFYNYLANCVGSIHYYLPGVFEKSPDPVVNLQLWTVPYELECYIAICALAFVGITQRKWLFLVAVAGIQIVFSYKFFFGYDAHNSVVDGKILVLCFLVGVLFHTLRDHIPYSKWLFALSLGTALLLFSIPRADYFVAFPAAYCTVFLGITNPRKVWPIETGDYSYGIYLYGYPIQQTVTALGLTLANPWLNFIISFPVALALAVASWHLWEKHWLNLRKLRPAIDKALRFTAPGAVTARLGLGA